MSILQEIIHKKKENLPTNKEISTLKVESSQVSFKEHISQKKKEAPINLIAEIKRKSPSKGNIHPNVPISSFIKLYSQYAQAISVLTENHYFGGNLDDLKKVSEYTQLPLLRKDFIISLEQIKESRYYQANAFLLITSALSKNQLEELILAGKEYHMDALVEVHSLQDLEKALSCKYVEILGINNRNLDTLQINLNQTTLIEKEIPNEIKNKLILVSESGISSQKDLLTLPSAIKAVLVGSNIMSSNTPEATLKDLTFQ